MFGSKTKELRAENQRMDNDLRSAGDLFARLADQDDRLQGYYADMQESLDQLEKSRQQLADNSGTASALIAESIGYMGQMGTALGLLGQQMLSVHNARKDAAEGLKAQKTAIEALGEGLSQADGMAKTPVSADGEENAARGETLELMSGLGKEMGVLALNAAIEAGRMGEDGRQFMEAAEQVRAHAAEYDKATARIKAMMEEDQKRIAELEKQITEISRCLEESKKAAQTLQEQQENVGKAVSHISGETLIDQLAGIKDVLEKTTEHEKQIEKIEERSQLQLADMQEEAKVFEDLHEEAKAQMRPLLDEAADYSLHIKH